MPDSTTLTVRLSNDTKGKLATLADRTQRTCSFVAVEAVAAYVERGLVVVEKVERGRADVRAGRVAPRDEVSHEARRITEAA